MTHGRSILPRLVPLALGLSLVACGSSAPEVAPASALYRLAMADVVVPSQEQALPVPAPMAPARTDFVPSHAYTVEIRLERLPVLGVVLDGVQGGSTLTAPSLTVYPDQRANIAVIDQHAFIQDFDIEVVEDGRYVVDPIVGVLQNGMTIDLLAQDASEGHVRLGFAVEQSDGGERHPERELRISSDLAPLIVQLPAVEVRRTTGVVEARLGTTVELFDWPAPDGGRVRALAQVTRVELRDDDRSARLAYIRDDLDVEAGRDDPISDFRSDAFPELDLRALTARAAEAVAPTEIAFVVVSDDGTAVLGEAQGLSGAFEDVETLDRFVWSSGGVAGSRYEARLMESYVSERVPVTSTMHDPRVATLLSGVSAVVRSDGALQVEWVATPVWPVASVEGIEADRPESRITGAVVPVTTTGLFVPLARTTGGRLAGVTVVRAP